LLGTLGRGVDGVFRSDSDRRLQESSKLLAMLLERSSMSQMGWAPTEKDLVLIYSHVDLETGDRTDESRLILYDPERDTARETGFDAVLGKRNGRVVVVKAGRVEEVGSSALLP
jgi:hypothetical protein